MADTKTREPGSDQLVAWVKSVAPRGPWLPAAASSGIFDMSVVNPQELSAEDSGRNLVVPVSHWGLTTDAGELERISSRSPTIRV